MKKNLPQHIGYIVDGNRRWAKAQDLPTTDGYDYCLQEALPQVLRTTFDAGISEISTWVFSTENWRRSPREVAYLMKLAPTAIDDYLLPLAHEYQAKVVQIGRRDRLPDFVQKVLIKSEAETAHYTKRQINICADYGGQDELVRAIQKIAEAKVPSKKITPELVSRYLDSESCRPLDLIVRTGGELRLSGFLLWLSSYSELFFTPKFFPELTPDDVHAILDDYAKRERRFGAK